MPVFRAEPQQQDPLVSNLINLFLGGVAQKRAQDRQAALDAQVAEDRRRTQAQQDFAHSLAVGQLRQQIAAQTPAAEAPGAQTAAQAGVPALGPDEGGPSPDQILVKQPESNVQIKDPMTGQTFSIPLQYKEQVLAAANEKARRDLQDTLLKEGAVADVREAVKAKYRTPPAPGAPTVKAFNGVEHQWIPDSSNPSQGEWKPLGKSEAAVGREAKGEAGLSPAGENTFLGRAAREWDKATEVRRSVDRQVRVMNSGLAAAARGDLAAGSQAVLVTFQKILDPTSVVRESEYARSASGQALLARAEGALEQLQKGGAGVPLAELTKFANLAKEIARATNEYENTVRSRLTKQAERYKIDPVLIFGEAPAEAPAPDLSGQAAPKGNDPLGIR